MHSSKLINLTLLSLGAMGSSLSDNDTTLSSHLRKLVQYGESTNFYETVVAEYDPNYGAPFCRDIGNECSSGDLLNGRGEITGGNENNTPNTLDGCPDGNMGEYWVDESLEKIVVRAGAINGTGVEELLEAGNVATIVATVFPFYDGTFNSADFYYASETNQEWTFIDSVWLMVGGLQDLVVEYILPPGELQAVRVNFRSSPGSGPCTGGNWDERDDLLFTVVEGPVPEPCLVNERVELLLEGMCSYEALYDAVAEKLLERFESCPRSDPSYEITSLLNAESEMDSRSIVNEMCKDAIILALTESSPFEFDRFTGMDHDFNKAFFDGQSSWNDGGMTKKKANKASKEDDDDEASAEWHGNSKAVVDIFQRHADRRQVTWPDNYRNFEDCQLNAAMCCWVDYDASLGPEYHNNTEICYVDNERAPSSNHINAGFSLYGDIHGREEAFCHGFAWESDSLDDYFKGNLLFISEVYDNMHTAGLSNNVPGKSLLSK